MKKGSSLEFTENFYVVEFNDGLALVPNNWLRISDQKQQICFYPNYDVKKRLNKTIQSKEIPDLKNVKAGWMMYDVLRIFASADTFERGQEKLTMAESISDINTEDEENIKQTRHDRAAAKNLTSSDDESSGAEVDSSLLSPLPDPKEFSGSQLFRSKKSAQILATYEHPIISSEKIEIIKTHKKKQSLQQEIEVIAKRKKTELEDNNEGGFIDEDNVHSIDEYNKETTHLNKNNEDQFQKG
ncbi:uncharacterized protein LOC112638174 [Camponotus floridanus]|uniref:uncharacterized protein LOC112638174 n=1 Tax=Camponotus floridanus TaxID=104421 RepID=UPI000DC67CC4|nr:uncharacterized protein LOC112638174 [Camponotus floridanus]